MPRALSSEIPFNIPGLGSGGGWGGEPPRRRCGILLLLVFLAIGAGAYYFAAQPDFRGRVDGLGQKAVSIVRAPLVREKPTEVRTPAPSRYVAVSDTPVQPGAAGPWRSGSSQRTGNALAPKKQSDEETHRALVEAFEAGQVVMK